MKPVKFLSFAALLISAFPVSSVAQNDYHKHELSLSIGFGAEPKSLFNDAIKSYELSRGFVGQGFNIEDYKQDNYTHMMFEYSYYLSSKFAVGLNMAYHVSESELFSKEEGINKPEYLALPEDQRPYNCTLSYVKSHVFSVLPSVKYRWFIFGKNNGYKLYSQASLGVAFITNKAKYSDPMLFDPAVEGPFGPYEYPNIEKENHVNLAYNVTALGFETGKNHSHWFVEVGYGYKGVFNTGYRFSF